MPRGSSSILWFKEIFGFDEASFTETQRNFVVEAQAADLGHVYQGPAHILKSIVSSRDFYVGPFECASASELKRRLSAHPQGRELGSLTFKNVTGCVQSLHRAPENIGAVFQVASQFNCLEMVGPSVRPEDGVARYASDPTQGPACAMVCPGATVYRNYFVDGKGQGFGRQIDTLQDVGRAVGNDKHHYWKMTNGYCLPQSQGSMAALSARLKQDAHLQQVCLISEVWCGVVVWWCVVCGGVWCGAVRVVWCMMRGVVWVYPTPPLAQAPPCLSTRTRSDRHFYRIF